MYFICIQFWRLTRLYLEQHVSVIWYCIDLS